MKKTDSLVWEACYKKRWKGLIVPDAFSHPAKFSLGLIERIYEHLFEMGWVKEGDLILDPFGGVALGGYWAMKNGLNWVGIELEEKFVNLGKQNIELWAELSMVGTAILIQGDSRKLKELLQEASAVISSPPYVGIELHSRKSARDEEIFKGRTIGTHGLTEYGEADGQLANMEEGEFDAVVSSPPFQGVDTERTFKSEEEKQVFIEGQKVSHPGRSDKALGKMMGNWSGLPESEGQLGTMKEGEFDAIVSSPPFQAAQEGGGINKKGYTSRPDLGPDWVGDRTYNKRMVGETEGQLGQMKEGNFDAVVASPPFSDCERGGTGVVKHPEDCKCNYCLKNKGNAGNVQGGKWGLKTVGQLGSMKEGEFDAVISSPPYSETSIASDGQRGIDAGDTEKTAERRKRLAKDNLDYGKYGKSDGQLGNMKEGEFDAVVSSPPWESGIAEVCVEKGTRARQATTDRSESGGHDPKYGTTEGQLGHMKEGEFDAVISSPPYAEGIGHDPGKNADKENHPDRYKEQDKYMSAFKSEGNLGSMKDKDFDAVVSSPPWESIEGSMQAKKFKDGSAEMLSKRNKTGAVGGHYASPEARKRAMDKANQQDYGKTGGNLGNSSGDTFWSASKVIVQQCYNVLKPGGYAIWVCKDFVRNKKRVLFSEQWTKLCESVGFEFVCGHQASLVERTVRDGLFQTDEQVVERKSFFRRLAEQKGSPRIDWEDVICMRKPE